MNGDCNPGSVDCIPYAPFARCLSPDATASLWPESSAALRSFSNQPPARDKHRREHKTARQTKVAERASSASRRLPVLKCTSDRACSSIALTRHTTHAPTECRYAYSLDVPLMCKSFQTRLQFSGATGRLRCSQSAQRPWCKPLRASRGRSEAARRPPPSTRADAFRRLRPTCRGAICNNVAGSAGGPDDSPLTASHQS